MIFSCEKEILESLQIGREEFLRDRRAANDKLKDFDVSLRVELRGLQKADRNQNGSDGAGTGCWRSAMRSQTERAPIGSRFTGMVMHRLDCCRPQHQQRTKHRQPFSEPTHVFPYPTNLQPALGNGNVTAGMRM
jgi:hypothetical protein